MWLNPWRTSLTQVCISALGSQIAEGLCRCMTGGTEPKRLRPLRSVVNGGM